MRCSSMYKRGPVYDLVRYNSADAEGQPFLSQDVMSAPLLRLVFAFTYDDPSMRLEPDDARNNGGQRARELPRPTPKNMSLRDRPDDISFVMGRELPPVNMKDKQSAALVQKMEASGLSRALFAPRFERLDGRLVVLQPGMIMCKALPRPFWSTRVRVVTSVMVGKCGYGGGAGAVARAILKSLGRRVGPMPGEDEVDNRPQPAAVLVSFECI